jgi:molybdopterin converting factor small subunit
MGRVTVELWLWLSKELEEDFEFVSEMRSRRDEELSEGMTVRDLMESMARRYPPLAREVFDLREKRTYPHVIINYNESVISPHVVNDQVLRDGDKITVLPMYMGG